MTILEKSKAPGAPEVATALNMTAMWHIYRKELVEAEAKMMQALAISEKRLASEGGVVASYLDSLGALHAAQAEGIDFEAIKAEVEAEVEGKPKQESKIEQHGRQAESFYTRALAIREKILEPGHRDIAASLFNLGQIALIRGRPAEGERYLERWLVLEENAKTPASEKHVKVLMMLAAASMERKAYAEAQQRLAKAQATLEAVNGALSNELTTMLLARASVAVKAGRFDDAESFIKNGLRVQSSLIGPDNADLVEATASHEGRI